MTMKGKVGSGWNRRGFSKSVLYFAGLTALSLLLVLICFPFLPEQIAVQWDGLAVVSTAPKGCLFLAPALCLFLALCAPLCRASLENRGASGRLATYTAASLLLMLLTCEGYLVFFALVPQVRIPLPLVLTAEAAILIIVYPLSRFRRGRGK